MSIQLLIASMRGQFLSSAIVKSLPENIEYSVINQYSEDKEKIENDRVFNYQEFGLSKSRNHNLQKAESDICLICDDDESLLSGAEKKICQIFSENPDADIITFQIVTPDGTPFRKYSKTQHDHNSRSLLRVSSIEIAFRLDSIKKVGIQFDENFGLGAKFSVGEENIFLMDALNANLKIIYHPTPVAIHPAVGTGLRHDNEELFIARGAFFMRAYAWKGPFYTFAYFLKNFHRLNKFYSPLKLLRLLISGNFKYLFN